MLEAICVPAQSTGEGHTCVKLSFHTGVHLNSRVYYNDKGSAFSG